MRTPRIDRYVLNEAGEPEVEPDLLKWGRWMEGAKRQVAEDTVDGVWISTVFLGLDHNFVGGPPVLWETCVFEDQVGHVSPSGRGIRESNVVGRYASKDAALAGHAEAVVEVMNRGKPGPLTSRPPEKPASG